MSKRCGTCRYYDAKLGKNGLRVLTKRHAYPCTVDVPAPTLPDSMTRLYLWKWPPHRYHQTPNDRETCPLRENAAKVRI